MSTFGGLMVEYPQIAIDRFQGPAVLRARAYFLSHAHADHMVGLHSNQFSHRLHHSRHVNLYCSEVTHQFLLTDRRFVHLAPSIISLPIEEPTTITLHNEMNGKVDQVLVTLLPAGHCPGSVMFLFEGDEGKVLYTGDFRFAKGEAARMPSLHSGNRVKDIKSVYADTTFCVPEAMDIPSREQSRDALLDLVEKQISKSPTHMVRLACKAKYGYEYLFVEISKEFNLKVHVSPVVMAQYDRVPDLAAHLTTDGRTTQVHACRYVDCRMHSATDVLVVVPSTMWFTSNALPSDVLKKDGHRHRICFSFHSSLSEVRDFLGYIHPVNIYANVIPYNCTEEQINERLQDLKRGANKMAVSRTLTYRPLGQLKKSARTSMRKNVASCVDDDSEDDLFDSSPPPIKKKKKREPTGEGASEQNMSVSRESGDCLVASSQQSYLAMDDSDLSSGELDLYDSVPSFGHSQEGTAPTRLETGNSVETSCKSRDLSGMPDGQDTPNRRRGESSGDRQVLLESKRAEIDSWLRYLPSTDASLEESAKVAEERQAGTHSRDRHPSPELHSAAGAAASPRGWGKSSGGMCGSAAEHGAVTELNCSQGESDKTDEYSINNSQEISLPPCAKDLNYRKDPSVKLEESCCKVDQFSGSLIDIERPACEPTVPSSAKPEKVTVDPTDNLPPEQHDILSMTPNDPIHKIFKPGSVKPKVESIKFHQRENVKRETEKGGLPAVTIRLHDPVHRNVIRTGPSGSAVMGSQTHSVRPEVQPSKRHQDATVRQDEEYPCRPESKDDDRSRGTVQKTLAKTESHVARSSQSPSAGSAVQGLLHGAGDPPVANELSSQTAGSGASHQSQDTFLPSSQGSVVSRCSSDFDVPCTPEGKELRPDQVEAIRVMIAREEVVPLASCRRKMQLD